MENTDPRKMSPEAQYELRVRAVNMVLAGLTRKKTAQLIGVSEKSVGKWVKDFEAGGKAAIKPKKRGRPPGHRILKGHQPAQVYNIIRDDTPDQLNMPFHLWTREAVRKLIFELFGIILHVNTVGRYLKRWGFTPQKPLRRAYEQNPKEVAKWLNDVYPSIKQSAKAEGALIYWGDEMGMRSDHQSGRSYSKKGITPVIKGTGKRFRCNQISAITNQGHLNFMVFKDRFTSDVFIEFLRRLIKQAMQRVYIIVDGHPVHRSRKTREWLEKLSAEIKMFMLPGYSPSSTRTNC